jgi:Fic-DOC domain mobile mystery protein B
MLAESGMSLVTDIFKSVGDDTLLTEGEKADLIPTYITTKGELNDAEQENIINAEYWTFKKRNRKVEEILSESFIRKLHEKMFCDVWRWAGMYRLSDKNIGVPNSQLRGRIQQLLGDVQYWIPHNTYPSDEIAIRFHHQLVYIHPFSNGNGRHARLLTDILITKLGGKRFSWGGESLYKGEDRKQYIDALKEADNGNIQALLRVSRA